MTDTHDEGAGLVKDCRLAARCLKATGTYPSGQSILFEAADRIAALEEQVARLTRHIEGARTLIATVEASYSGDPEWGGEIGDLDADGWMEDVARWSNAMAIDALRCRPSPAPSEAVREHPILRRTFAVQHNPNCPSSWLVRLPGKGLAIDLKPYSRFTPESERTGDILGFGKTFEEASNAALASEGERDG